MSVINRLASRLGFMPRQQAADLAQRAAQLAARRVAAHHGRHQQRTLQAALTTPDVASWQTDGAHINTESAAGLAVLRSRSRQAATDNEHAIRFLTMVASNVLGPMGMRYQSRLRTAAGALRTADNDRLEAGWAAFCRRGALDVTGRYGMRQFERLALRHVVVDGECFVRLRTGRGPHGLQLQLLTADAVPLINSADLGAGRKVRQGVEFDADGRVLAYHFRTDDATLDLAGVLGGASAQRLLRVPADEVLHLMLPMQAGQLRGLPWMHGALKRMYQASDFASAGLNKARESAKRGGFIQPDKDAVVPDPGPPPPAADGTAGQVDGAGTGQVFSSVVDGQWDKLLPGESAVAIESDYPNIEYGQFIKDCTRGIAAALGVSYITLGNDLEAVNYSSGQLGLEEERTFWMGLQEWLLEDLSRAVQRRWLDFSLLAAPELAGLSFDRRELYAAAARWQAHRWKPLDKLKSVEADRSEIEAGLNSPQRVIEARGDDPDEIVEELREWLAKTADIRPALAAMAGATSGATSGAGGQADDSQAPQQPSQTGARKAQRLRLISHRFDE